jgi:hypothetical protein
MHMLAHMHGRPACTLVPSNHHYNGLRCASMRKALEATWWRRSRRTRVVCADASRVVGTRQGYTGRATRLHGSGYKATRVLQGCTGRL